MDEQNSEYSLKIQEFMKHSMVEYTADSSKLHEYLKQNLVDFPTGELLAFFPGPPVGSLEFIHCLA